MKMRLLCLGILVTLSQLCATGCHPIQRWRSNHPCGVCGPCGPCSSASQAHPLLHPVQTRRAAHGDVVVGGPVVGPVVGAPPCHGCGGTVVPGAPVGYSGKPGDVVPITGAPMGYPPIGYPMPITPGPTVVPSYELPNPMPVPKNN